MGMWKQGVEASLDLRGRGADGAEVGRERGSFFVGATVGAFDAGQQGTAGADDVDEVFDGGAGVDLEFGEGLLLVVAEEQATLGERGLDGGPIAVSFVEVGGLVIGGEGDVALAEALRDVLGAVDEEGLHGVGFDGEGLGREELSNAVELLEELRGGAALSPEVEHKDATDGVHTGDADGHTGGGALELGRALFAAGRVGKGDDGDEVLQAERGHTNLGRLWRKKSSREPSM